MSTVDDRPDGDTERQLAAYFTWLEAELGPVAVTASEARSRPTVAPARERSVGTWRWLAAAAAAVALLAGLALGVGRDGGDETVPASPTGDLRDVSGWFELDLPGVEVVETFTTDPETVPAVHRDPYYVWADLDGDPIRSMSASFFDGDVPLDLDDDIDPPERIESAPGGEAWVVDDPAEGANLLRVQWTRPDGTVLLTSGTGVDAATLAAWTFTVGADPAAPPAAPDPSLELVLDASTVESMPQYQENWTVDGTDVSAWVATESPAVWLGLGYPTVERFTIDGRDGYRFGGGREDQAVLVTFPLRNGYWGHLSMRADRADDFVDHIVIVDDSFPTPDEVTTGTIDGDDDAETDDLAKVWHAVVADELAAVAPELEVELTSASETYPIGAVARVPVESGGRLLVDLRIWATGEYDDEGSWLEATGATRFGTSFPEGAIYSETSDTRDRVGIVTALGVVELVVEVPVDGAPDLPLADVDDPDGFEGAVDVLRRLATRLPDVIATSGIDVDAGTICAERGCEGGQALARLRIPAIGVDLDVRGSSRTEVLADGPGLAPGSVPIGSPGVIRIWGDRTSSRNSFVDLGELDPGHQIALVTPSGAGFSYFVESVEVVDRDAPVAAAETATLVLSTQDPASGSRRELRVTARICTACRDGSLPPFP